MPSLLDKRLVVVTGKGGVGKTTVAAALGLAAARLGKRTVICEVSEQERLAGMFGRSPLGHEEGELAPGLFGISVVPERAKEEWLRRQLRSGALAGVLGHSRIFNLLTAAAPGLNELVTIGKVWDLAQLERRLGGSAYDLAILDAPATGHSVAMLRAPRTFANVAAGGPIHRQAMMIHDFLADPKSTGVLAVALPEEMPVNETLDLGERLRGEMGMEMNSIVVNALLPERFSTQEAEQMAALDGKPSKAVRAAVAAALTEHRRARAQRSQLRRLRRETDVPVTTLPYLFEPDLGSDALDRLSRELERRL